MKDQIEALIAEYELSLQNLRYDQLTDDAMNNKQYLGIKETLERVVRDLKIVLR